MPGVLAGLCGVVLVLSLLPESNSRFFAWPWYSLWQLVLALPPVLLLLRLLGTRSSPRGFGLPLDAGFLLLLGTFSISGLLSPVPGMGTGLLALPLALVAAAYLVLDLLSVPAQAEGGGLTQQRLLTCAAILSGAFVVSSLVLWLRANPESFLRFDLRAMNRNSHPFGHSLYTAGAALLALPFLVLEARRRGPAGRYGWGLLSAGAVVVVLGTKSRAGVLGLVCGGTAALAVWLWLRRSPLKQVLLLTGAGCLLSLSVVLLDPRLSTLVRTGSWGASARASNEQRDAMLVVGRRMAADHPLLGQGPGSTPLVYATYRSGLPGAAPSALELHSTPLQVLAELGLAGLAGLLLITYGVLSRLVLLLQREARPTTGLLVPALAYLAIGYAVTSWYDFQLDVPLIGLLLVLGLAAGFGGRGEMQAPTARMPGWKTTAGVLSVLLLVSLAAQFRELRARWTFASAAEAREAGDHAAFLEGTRQAAALDGRSPYYLNQLASALAAPGIRGVPPQPRQARDILLQSLARYPNQDYAHYNLGWLFLSEDAAVAERHFREAARLAPSKARVYLGLAIALLNQGRKEKAADALALEFLNTPESFALVLWDDPSLAELRREAKGRADRIRLSLASKPECPPELRKQLVYDQVLESWWLSGEIPSAAHLEGATKEQRTFFARLRSPLSSESLNEQEPASLQRLRTLVAASTLPRDTQRAEELLALAQRHPQSVHDLLTAPVAQVSSLTVTSLSERVSYNLIMRNQDGWPPYDMDLLPRRLLLAAALPWLFNGPGSAPEPLLLTKLAHLDQRHLDRD